MHFHQETSKQAFLDEVIWELKSLYRRSSLSDGILAANQSNLALKGIIGIESMAEISLAVGQSNDSVYFQVGRL